MRELFVDFSLKPVGSLIDPRDFAIYTTTSREGRILDDSRIARRSEGKTLRLEVDAVGDAAARTSLGWKRAGEDGVFSDVEVVVAAAFDPNEVAADRKIGCGLRLPVDNSSVQHGIQCVLESSGFLSFERQATAGGTTGGIGRTNIGAAIEMGELYFIRAQLEGNTGRARAWKFTDPEPVDWLFEVTHGALADFTEGYVGPVLLGTTPGLHTEYLRIAATDDLEVGAATERFSRYLVDRR